MKRLLKLALLAGIAGAIVKAVAARRQEWMGLTETEVRTKLDDRFPAKMPADKRSRVADQVVAKMRDRGVLRDETEVAAPPAPGEVDDTAEDTPESL